MLRNLPSGARNVKTLMVGEQDKVGPVQDVLHRDAGFEPTTVRTLEQAIELVGCEAYDLVILFLSLPDTPGLVAFQWLFPRVPDSAVVMISPTPDDRTAFLALTHGAQDFLVEGEYDDKTLVRSMVFACARHAYREVHRELETVKKQMLEVAAKMGEIQSAYRDLLKTVTALNETIIATGRINDAAKHPR